MKRILLITIILITCQAIAQIPTDNLEAYYPFNGNANDASSNTNNGTVSGPVLSTDRFGSLQSAYTFGGGSDIINIPYSTSLDFDGLTDNFSVNLWCKGSAPTAGSGVCRIIEKWNGLLSTPYPITIGVLSNTELYNAVYDGTNNPQARYTSSIWDGKWHMVTVIVALDSISVFIDGIFSLSEVNTVTSSAQNSLGFTFGNNPALSRPYIGQLDDIRFYSDILTECEIWSLFNEGTNLFDLGVSQSSNILTSNETNATYQWIDCIDNTIIPGATNQTYAATSNGNYAVILNDGICSDTSACFNVTSIGIIENDFGDGLILFPNPTDGEFSIDMQHNYPLVIVSVTDLNGKLIQSVRYENSQLLTLRLALPTGVYLLNFKSVDKKATIRLVKK